MNRLRASGETIYGIAGARRGSAAPPRSSLPQRLQSYATLVAPTTLAAALLYYFGYVTTYAKFAYFGIDLSLLHLSTQDLALQSVAVLYVPVGLLMVLAAGYYAAYRVASRLIARRHRRRLARRSAIVFFLLAIGLLARALAGIAIASIAARERPGLTPGSLGLGAQSALVGAWLWSSGSDTSKRQAGQANLRVVAGLVAGITVLSLFWITNSFAAVYGRSQAQSLSVHLKDRRPGVVLDTPERLYLHDPGIVETSLPDAGNQRFHFRYRGFRLLLEADNRLFLIPEQWRTGGDLLVLPADGNLRVQFVGG